MVHLGPCEGIGKDAVRCSPSVHFRRTPGGRDLPQDLPPRRDRNEGEQNEFSGNLASKKFLENEFFRFSSGLLKGSKFSIDNEKGAAKSKIKKKYVFFGATIFLSGFYGLLC